MLIFFVKWLRIYIYFFLIADFYIEHFIFLFKHFPAWGDFSECVFPFDMATLELFLFLPVGCVCLCEYWVHPSSQFSGGSFPFQLHSYCKTYPVIHTTTHRCCRSRHRRWAPPASCRGSAPWSPDRSCRWGWAPPPAGRRQDGRKGKDREERQWRLSVSFHSIIVQMSTTKRPCASRHSGRLCVCVCVLTSQEQPGNYKDARKQQL